MSKFLISFTAVSTLVTGLALPEAPAAAQAPGSGDEIGYVIVYGNDPCPRSTDSEVVVCARKPETERYRIPERYRESGPRQTRQSWAQKAKAFEYVGQTGTMSCSAVGPGGYTGCLQNMIDRAKAEAREAATKGVPPPESAGPGPGY
jgi:hypothetical protein